MNTFTQEQKARLIQATNYVSVSLLPQIWFPVLWQVYKSKLTHTHSFSVVPYRDLYQDCLALLQLIEIGEQQGQTGKKPKTHIYFEDIESAADWFESIPKDVKYGIFICDNNYVPVLVCGMYKTITESLIELNKRVFILNISAPENFSIWQVKLVEENVKMSRQLIWSVEKKEYISSTILCITIPICKIPSILDLWTGEKYLKGRD